MSELIKDNQMTAKIVQVNPETPSNALASAVAESPAKPAITKLQIHCPYRQATLLQQALAPDKMRVAFFLGAGCPVAIRVPNGTGTNPLIPDIAELTRRVSSKIEASATYKAGFAALKRLSDSGTTKPHIEQILSHVRALAEVVCNSSIDGLSKEILNGIDEEICKLTTEVVQAKLPGDDTPYHQLATWIGGVPRAHAVEVFTSNYDLLMEQSLEERRVPYFDGFVGSANTFFDVASMEQGNLPARWARLWKVHGSINWWRTKRGNVERRNGAADGSGDRQMIYPSHLKYDQSRRLPYLAMLDRLRAFLANGQAVLITCGYSFADQHLNEVILQGLSGNPNAICFGLLYGDRASYPEAVSRARKQSNLSLLAVDGAVLNTLESDWHSIKKDDHIQHGLAVETGDMQGRTNSPPDRSKFMLGDFKTFGLFLAQHLARNEETGGENNAK
jgi:hypothetical protein